MDGARAVLRGPEHHHLCRVLRAKPGDKVWLFDDEGRRYQAELASAGENESRLNILDVLEPREFPTRIILAAALLKAGAMDEVILRATELGAVRIVPVEAERSVARAGDHPERKVERWSKIALAAAKQSRAARPPAIDAPVPLADFLAGCRSDRRFILDENGGMSLKRLRGPENPPPAEAAVLIGPEGGWTDAERKAAAAAEFEPVGLGRTVLRAETAALSVLTILAFEWNW